MKELLSTVTTKGQVTIPIEVRRLLQLATHEKVAFIVEGNQVCLARRGSVVQRTAGMLKAKQPPLTAEQEREAAEKAIAEDVVERLKGENDTTVS